MDYTVLKELKKGEEGTGLLIENDGYISMDMSENRSLFESHHGEGDEFRCPSPFIVSAVFQKFGVRNANGRIYPEDVIKKEVERYMEKIRSRNAIGEANHPDETSIDLDRVAINIIELHWEGHTLVGKMEILTSYGFRKYGIISCKGDQIANLLLHGIKIGVSSRGAGSLVKRMDALYVCDDYELICWDVVSDPSTPNAWITPEDRIPEIYKESVNSGKKLIDERIDSYREWLNL